MEHLDTSRLGTALANRRLNQAAFILSACEGDLRRELTKGEARDLLADNTEWSRDEIARAVSHLKDDPHNNHVLAWVAWSNNHDGEDA